MVTHEHILHVLAIDHQRAALDVRAAAARALAELNQRWSRSDPDDPPAAEWVLIQTCYRTELVTVSTPEALVWLKSWAHHNLPVPPLSIARAAPVFRRITLLAAGCLSPTLGEPEVAHQVKNAYLQARIEGHCGAILSRLFETALHTAKRIRSETGIQNGHGSIPAITAARVEAFIPRHAPVFLVGTGEIAEGVARALAKHGYTNLTVASRTRERAASFTQRIGVGRPTVWDFNLVPEYITRHSVVISATAAPYYLWTHEVVAQHMPAGARRLFIDLAVPRDVEPSVGQIPGVRLVTVDDLKEDVAEVAQEKSAALRTAHEIAQTASLRFEQWFLQQILTDQIRFLYQSADQVRREEIERFLRKNGHDPKLAAEIEQLTHRLVRKILHISVAQLKTRALSSAEEARPREHLEAKPA